MADVHRIFGNELSPYSVKVRSYFRYKEIPHEWIVRSAQNEEEFRQHAKLPLIPLVIAPEGSSLQDSTPIIEHYERRVPEPALAPADPVLAFLSALVEEYADEWGNKPMFHYRWTYAPDQEASADRLARSMSPGLDDEAYANIRAVVKERMIPRLAFVGSSAATRAQIEGSYLRLLTILEKHLAKRRYLFGGRPSLGDFGLAGQLYECSIDPTPGQVLRERAPNVLAWIGRMLEPTNDGPFETWDSLHATLLPLLSEEIGKVFFPWSLANAQALAAGEPKFTLTLDGAPFTQDTQKYHAKSLAALRARYAAVADRSMLDPILERAGCLAPLRS